MARDAEASEPSTRGTQRAGDSPKPVDRVARIKRMMVEGEWREGVSDHELADEWGIDPSTVRHSSAEASRALRTAAEDQGFAGRLIAILLNNVHDARQARRFEAVAKSVEVAAKIMGYDGQRPPSAGQGATFEVVLTDEPPK